LNGNSDFIGQYVVVIQRQWLLERDQACTYIAFGSYWGMYIWTLSADSKLRVGVRSSGQDRTNGRPFNQGIH
jgi:hypothetical protein